MIGNATAEGGIGGAPARIAKCPYFVRHALQPHVRAAAGEDPRDPDGHRRRGASGQGEPTVRDRGHARCWLEERQPVKGGLSTGSEDIASHHMRTRRHPRRTGGPCARATLVGDRRGTPVAGRGAYGSRLASCSRAGAAAAGVLSVSEVRFRAERRRGDQHPPKRGFRGFAVRRPCSRDGEATWSRVAGRHWGTTPSCGGATRGGPT